MQGRDHPPPSCEGHVGARGSMGLPGADPTGPRSLRFSGWAPKLPDRSEKGRHVRPRAASALCSGVSHAGRGPRGGPAARIS